MKRSKDVPVGSARPVANGSHEDAIVVVVVVAVQFFVGRQKEAAVAAYKLVQEWHEFLAEFAGYVEHGPQEPRVVFARAVKIGIALKMALRAHKLGHARSLVDTHTHGHADTVGFQVPHKVDGLHYCLPRFTRPSDQQVVHKRNPRAAAVLRGAPQVLGIEVPPKSAEDIIAAAVRAEVDAGASGAAEEVCQLRIEWRNTGRSGRPPGRPRLPHEYWSRPAPAR